MRESDYGYDPPDEVEFDEDKERRGSVALDNRWKEDRRMADYDEDGANEDREEELCGHCNGSGEGMHPGTRCQWCKGSGVERETEEGPGPDDGPGEE